MNDEWPRVLSELREVMAPVRVTAIDCGAIGGVAGVPWSPYAWYLRGRLSRLVGRVLAFDLELEDPPVAANTVLTPELVDRLDEALAPAPAIHSPLTCRAEQGVCALCYGADPKTSTLAPLGAPVGPAAIEALEQMPKGRRRKRPGFMLGSVTRPRLVRSRTAGVVRYGPLAPGMTLISGRDYAVDPPAPIVILLDDEDAPGKFCLTVEGIAESHELENEAQILVGDGDSVAPGTPLFQVPAGCTNRYLPRENGYLARLFDMLAGKPLDPPFVLAPFDGVVAVSRGPAGEIDLSLTGEGPAAGERWRRVVPDHDELGPIMVSDGDRVRAGDELVSGHLDLAQLYGILGDQAAALAALAALQDDLESRRVYVEDRHLELILARRLRDAFGA